MLTFYKYEHNNINKLFLKNANVIAKKKKFRHSLTFVRIKTVFRHYQVLLFAVYRLELRMIF